MANITQTIHSLNAGISQQPDEQKIPGQVRDMLNAVPDITQGLLKRPAGEFVSTLTNSTNNGKWFHYYRDENEQYIGQIRRDGLIKMWACVRVLDPLGNTLHEAGDEVNVVDATTGTGAGKYLYHTGDEDIQTLTLNDFTYLNNRTKTPAMLTGTNDVEPAGNYLKEVFIELKSISYAKQYSVNLFDSTDPADLSTVRTATRIRVDMVKSSNNYCNSSGNMVAKGSRKSQTTRCAASSGDNRDAYAPNVGTKIFNIGSGSTYTDDGSTYADGTHTVNINGNNSSGRSNLYFRIATTGQSVPFTTGSGENQTTTYQARYTTTYDLLHGGEGWHEGDTFDVFMKNAIYTVTVEQVSISKVQSNLALVRPNPTPFDTETTITAESILGDIREGITGSTTATTGNGFTVTQIGTGLHVSRATNFNGSTPVGELLNVVAGKVNDAGDLPTQCKHGMIVEVVNSTADEDNYFVKFEGNNGKDGEGSWTECAKPGRAIRFNRATMPVVLIRTADANFRLTELDGSTYTIGGVTQPAVPKWDDALVGDEDTNPEPDFIGRPINKMCFFRNRFTMLADEFIIMSRPGDFTNFFAKSAIQLIASDPINISASSTYPATLFDAIEVNTGLVLFAKSQQFMLTTDSDTFSPLTAKINALSTYNFNFTTNPISLGTTIGFLDNAGKFSRFYEMARILREGEPQVIEQSAVVSRLFEKDLKTISNSRENSIIFFSEDSSSTLYGYRYFDQIEDRKLASWFRWTLPGTIKYHCIQDDALFVVLENGSQRDLLRYSIKMDSDTVALYDNRVHMDYLMPVAALPSSAYSGGKTTFARPSGLNGGNTNIVAYDIDDTADPKVAVGNYATITVNGNNLEITGDWTGQAFYIGYQYTMSITMPTIYYVRQEGQSFRSDTRANTIIHRVKLGFGPVGFYQIQLQRTGKPDWNEDYEVTPADTVLANSPGVFNDDILRTVPIYDRNINTTLIIKSAHPSPATLHHLTWEGVYNNNFYQRV